MFREEYQHLHQQLRPDSALIQDTIRKADACQKKEAYQTRTFRRSFAAVCSVFLCLFLAMPVLAARVEPVYELLYLVSPAAAQFFMPVQQSDEDNGIRMEVLSASIEGSLAEIYVSMQDLTGERIDETTDLFDSYSIHCPFSNTGYCEQVAYDEQTQTATFYIRIEAWDRQDLSGDKVTFTVREFLSHKKRYEDVEIPLDLSAVGAAKETQSVSPTGLGGMDFEKMGNNLLALVPSAPDEAFPVDGIDLTGIGYIQGSLHIQTAVTDNLDKDNHGFFYLKDRDGNELQCDYNFYFVSQEEQPGRVDYCNYVFDVPEGSLSDYTLYGYFVTSGMKTEGNWSVTFSLEENETEGEMEYEN